MGGQYPLLDRSQVEKILKKLDFVIDRQKGTSHAQWEGTTKGLRRMVTVRHLKSKKEKYGPKLINRMIKQSGLTKEEFYEYI